MRWRRRGLSLTLLLLIASAAGVVTACMGGDAGRNHGEPRAGSPPPTSPELQSRQYSVHTSIVATTFWVGEIFDSAVSDGSQEISTYDDAWMESYGGWGGVGGGGVWRG